jgi:hypothetical protein
MMFHHQEMVVWFVTWKAQQRQRERRSSHADRRNSSATPQQRIGAPKAKAGKAATHSWISQENEQVLP